MHQRVGHASPGALPRMPARQILLQSQTGRPRFGRVFNRLTRAPHLRCCLRRSKWMIRGGSHVIDAAFRAARHCADAAALAVAGANDPNARAVVAVNSDSELLPVTRANGVPAALVVLGGGKRGLIAGTSALIQLDGWNWEEMAIEREAALHVVLPSLRLTPQALEPLPGVLLLELRKFTRQQLQKIDDAFFAAAAYQRARPNAPGCPADHRWEKTPTRVSGCLHCWPRPVMFSASHATAAPSRRPTSATRRMKQPRLSYSACRAARRCSRSRCTRLRSWAWPTAWIRWRPVGWPVSSLPTAIRWTQRHV